ncbi:MAG: hypothetical protein ACTS6A_00775 [Candidatus Hodgkinia cicadicola]
MDKRNTLESETDVESLTKQLLEIVQINITMRIMPDCCACFYRKLKQLH